MIRPERAVLLHKKSQLSGITKGNFSRIYFGSETCDFLLPSKTDIDVLANIRERFNIDFTIVTPYITQRNFPLADKLLRHLNKNFPFTEIVVNDWGVLNLIRGDYDNFRMILGRILNRQSRGLFFVNTKASEVELVSDMKWTKKEDLVYFKASITQNDYAMHFFKSLNIKRVSLDNLKQGILLDNNDEIKIDLYYPYCYLTSSPHCLTRALSKKPHLFQRATRCDKICLKKEVEKVKICNETIYLAGNSQLYFNDKVNASVLKKIDRLIKVVP
jgi:hypothetical protein